MPRVARQCFSENQLLFTSRNIERPEELRSAVRASVVFTRSWTITIATLALTVETKTKNVDDLNFENSDLIGTQCTKASSCLHFNDLTARGI